MRLRHTSRVRHFASRSGALLTALAVAVAIQGSMPTTASAEEPDEVLIGTFKVRSYAPPPAPTAEPALQPAPAPAPAAKLAPPARDSATDKLGEALALFAAGDRTGGQRALEVLVADWPASPEAAHARRALADIYRQAAAEPSAAPAVAPPPAAPPPPAAATTAAAPAVLPPPPSAPSQAAPAQAQAAVGSGWLTEVRRDGGLDRRFILEVGDRVFFGLGSAELGARARSVLSAQARWLSARPEVFAVIEGHADEPGSDAVNSSLAQQRADAVRDRLIEEGVGPDRLKAIGFGRGQRLAQCEEAECAAQNRRVVTAIYTRDGNGPMPPTSPLSALPPSPERATLTVAGDAPAAALLATVAPALRPRR